MNTTDTTLSVKNIDKSQKFNNGSTYIPLRQAKRRTQSLDGLWDFGFTPAPEDAFRFDSKMVVPGCWDASVEYALRRGVGHYRRRITVAESGMYRLCFEGVVNSIRGELDGERILEHYGPHVPFVSKDFHLEQGNHELILHVDNRFGKHNTLLEKKCGWYCYGGIHRSVTLEKTPQFRVDHIAVTTLDVDGTTAGVEIQINLSNDCDDVAMRIETSSGEILFESQDKTDGGTLKKNLRLEDITPWSPQTPALYYVTVETPDDGLCERVGFRTIRAENRKLLLNGKEIKLRGINHHDYHPESGHTSDLLRVKRDLDIIKGMGMNFVRTSHYPKDSMFLDLCDEMGLMVWEETPGWQNGPDMMQTELFLTQHLQSVRDMVVNHYNHPSIILWGFLNEVRSEYEELRPVFEAIIQKFRELDSSRPLTFATNRLLHNPDKMLDLVDILSPNIYNGWYLGEYGEGFPEDPAGYFQELLKWFKQLGVDDKPIIIGEFGAGGTKGTHRLDRRRWSEEMQLDILEEALDAYDENPDIAGYAMWLFADTACCESKEIRHPNSHNSKGLLDEYRNPKMAYHYIKRRLTRAKRQ